MVAYFFLVFFSRNKINGFESNHSAIKWNGNVFLEGTTIGFDGRAMVFNAMVANHWSNDLLVTNHRSGLIVTVVMLMKRMMYL